MNEEQWLCYTQPDLMIDFPTWITQSAGAACDAGSVTAACCASMAGSRALILATRANIDLTLRSLVEPKTFFRSSMRAADSGKGLLDS